MIAEFTVIPIGAGESISPYVAECLKIVRASGLRHELTATCTIVEGELDDVMRTMVECHRKVRSLSPRVVTSIRLDDREGESNAIERKVRSVEEKSR
jgi:uncharacterized protein (TIGR00106 family)